MGQKHPFLAPCLHNPHLRHITTAKLFTTKIEMLNVHAVLKTPCLRPSWSVGPLTHFAFLISTFCFLDFYITLSLFLHLFYLFLRFAFFISTFRFLYFYISLSLFLHFALFTSMKMNYLPTFHLSQLFLHFSFCFANSLGTLAAQFTLN